MHGKRLRGHQDRVGANGPRPEPSRARFAHPDRSKLLVMHNGHEPDAMTDLHADLVTRARTLRPLIEGAADEAERDGTTTKKVVDAVAEEGLFWTMVPAVCGGAEAPIETALGVFEELAYADGSTGWSVMANASVVGVRGDLLRRRRGRRRCSRPVRPASTQACSVRSGGRRSRRRLRDLRQLSVRERVRTRNLAGGRRDGDEGRRTGRDRRRPAVAARRVPSPRSRRAAGQLGRHGPRRHRQLRLRGRATSSSDDGFTFRLLEAEPKRGGAMYRIGLFGLVASGHAGFALGVGKRCARRGARDRREQATHGQLRAGDRAAAVPARVRDARRGDARRRARTCSSRSPRQRPR